MAKSNRERQATYRDHKLKQGYTIVTIWLDPKTSKLLKGLKGNELSTFVCQAIKEAVTNNKPTVISNKVDNKTETVINNVTYNDTNNITNKRYMSTELENKILELRDSGLSLNETSKRLAEDGFLSITGKAYSTATIYKAEKRARQRKG